MMPHDEMDISLALISLPMSIRIVHGKMFTLQNRLNIRSRLHTAGEGEQYTKKTLNLPFMCFGVIPSWVVHHANQDTDIIV